MAYINAVCTTLPDHLVDQEKIREVGRTMLKGKIPFLDQALKLFDNAGVQSRYLVRPIDELLDNGDLGWRNGIFREESIRLGTVLTEEILAKTGWAPTDIDMIITTSCTGFMIPSLDAYLINAFNMRSDVKRLPLTELGCAAGAMALTRADDYLRAFPTHRVLIVAIELPSLTCQTRDFRLANLVSAALFGDGGAAALLSSDEGPCKIRGGQTHFFHQTPEMMGFDLDASGFRIILDKRISDLVLHEFRAPVLAFLERQDLALADVAHFVFHPGGRRIMDSLKQVLRLEEAAISASRKVLREVGNLSSASVLWVLAETLREEPEGPGIMAAFGPGFNAEMLALQFQAG